MAERFTRLFSLPEALYAEGSPVVISAGALQKDNQTGKVFAQLKFKNVTSKPIKAVKLKLFPLDTIGNAIEGAVEHEYLDLSAVRDEEFGQKTAVVFPNASTRGFSVEVTAVYFSDNSAWNGQNTEWSSLPKLESLEKNLADPELAKQYKLKYGADCKFAVLEHKDLWFCSCGALNNVSEDKCHICSMYLSYHKAQSIDELKRERNLRLEKEQRLAKEAQLAAEREAEAKRAAEAEKAKKTKKLMKVLIPLLAIMIAIVSIFVIIARKNSGVAEENFIEAIGNSMIEASEYAEKISSPSSDSEELVALYKTFAPYCGTFTWLNMDGTAVKEFSFVSDFYIEDGDVYWIYDDSDFTELSSLKAFYSNPKNESKPEYTFLQEPLLVDDMKAYERIEDDMMDLSVEFIDGKVVITSGYFENYLQGSKYVLTDKHYEIFSLTAEKSTGNSHKESDNDVEQREPQTTKQLLLEENAEVDGKALYSKIYEYENDNLCKETLITTNEADGYMVGFQGYAISEATTMSVEYLYDADNNLSKQYVYRNDGTEIDEYTFTYNSGSQLIQKTRDNVYDTGADRSEDMTYTYTYDASGNLIVEKWYKDTTSSVPYCTQEYKYDEHGERIYKRAKYSSGILSEFDYINEYDSQGRLIKNIAQSCTTEYQYDEAGNIIYMCEKYSDSSNEISYLYNNVGQVIKETRVYNNNSSGNGSIRTITYTYGTVA